MDKEKLLAIQELMDELIEGMEPTAEDFDMRLGKPKVDVVSIEGEAPIEDEFEMGEEGPEDELKERIMKLRG